MSKYPKSWPVGGHPVAESKVRQMQKAGPKWMRASGPGWVAEKQGRLSNVKIEDDPSYILLEWVEQELYDVNDVIANITQHWVKLNARTLAVLSRGTLDYGDHSIFSPFATGGISMLGQRNGFLRCMASPDDRFAAPSAFNPAIFTSKTGVERMRFLTNTDPTVSAKSFLRAYETSPSQYLSFDLYRSASTGSQWSGVATWDLAAAAYDETLQSWVLDGPSGVLRAEASPSVRSTDYAEGRIGLCVGGPSLFGGETYRAGWFEHAVGMPLTGTRYEVVLQDGVSAPAFLGRRLGPMCVKGPSRFIQNGVSMEWGAVIEEDAWGRNASPELRSGFHKYWLTFADMNVENGSRLVGEFGSEIEIDRSEYNAVPVGLTACPQGVVVLIHTYYFSDYPERPGGSLPMPFFRLARYSSVTGEALPVVDVPARAADDPRPLARYAHRMFDDGGRERFITPSITTVWA